MKKMVGKLEKNEIIKSDGQIRKDVLKIAFPMMLQNLVTTFLTLIDTFLVSGLGVGAVAALGIATQVFFFLFILLTFGTNSGISIFTAQFHGKRDERNMSRSVSLSIFIGLLIAVVFTFISMVFSRQLFAFFSPDPEVIKLGADFLWILAISFIFTGISFSISFAYRSIGRLKVTLIISVFAIGINIILNLILIPVYGVKGSAAGTLIARIIECLLLVAWLKYDKTFDISLKSIFSIDLIFFKKVMTTVLPVIINEGVWALGIVVYMYSFSLLGTKALASVQITNSILNFLNVIFMGIGNATAIIIGREIGAKNYGMVKRSVTEIMKISFVLSIVMTVVTIVMSGPLVGLFNTNNNLSEYVVENAVIMLCIAGGFNVFKVFNINMIIGVLRSGGDTRFSLFMEIGSIWFYGVPIALAGAYLFGFSLPLLYFAVTSEEFVKFFVGLHRYKSGKWLNNLVENVN